LPVKQATKGHQKMLQKRMFTRKLTQGFESFVGYEAHFHRVIIIYQLWLVKGLHKLCP